ncbi:MAG: DUF4394 domain-containing protein [Alphaproteobacteria bacterium]|jgi:hypothetical protein|nr:DUF4394 domain-containing protein [Alphaproteobacteria bacterium]
MLLASLLTATAAPLAAQTAIGLSGDRSLTMIDLGTGAVTGSQDVMVEGRLLGIDYRPNTDTLIAVTDAFEVVDIDPATGMTTPLVTMSMPLPIEGDTPVIVDINPAADALRFMSGTVNHRINLGTGAVMVDGSLHWDSMDGAPMVGATAYSNSFGKPDATAMYNIDTDAHALLRQTAPNDGTNVVIGELGAMIEGPVAFDIATDAMGTNTAWLSANGAIHTVSLDTGMVTQSWDIDGLDVTLRDMTVMTAGM